MKCRILKKIIFLAGDVNDEDNKRARKSNQGVQQRLYPILPDFETNHESSESDNENNCCTTASVSAMSSADEMKLAAQPLRGSSNDHHQHHNNQYDHGSDDENADRCEDSFYSCLLFLLCIE